MAEIFKPLQITNFGPPPNFDKVTNIGTGYKATSTPAAIGVPFQITLTKDAVAISQSDVVIDSFKADGRMRVINIKHVAGATVATADFRVRNNTQTENILGTTTPVTAATYANPAADTEIVEKDDIVELRTTTNGTGTITNLHVELTVEYIDAPSNVK